MERSPQILGFELASYAMPAGWRTEGGVNQECLSELAKTAFRPMVSMIAIKAPPMIGI